MSLSRRKFIKIGVATAFVTAVPLRTVGLAAQQNQRTVDDGTRDPLSLLTAASFAAYLHTQFQFSLKARRVINLELVEVSSIPAPADEDVRIAQKECFSLVFRGPLTVPLPQETYKISHPALGKFSLLVVPSGEEAQGLLYEAIINRRTPDL